MSKTEEFILKAKKIHGDKYDYSKVNYVNNTTKVCIICPEHGEFWQTPSNHLCGKGCIKCGGHNKIDKDEFSKLLSEKWGEDVILKQYEGYYKNAVFCCLKRDENGIIHGDFMALPHDMLDKRRKTICPKCLKSLRRQSYAMTCDDFVKKAKEIHGNTRYDYSMVEYTNNSTKVFIICHDVGADGKEHGGFWQTPANHLRTRGCPLCKNEKLVYENNIYSILLDILEPNEIIRQYRNSNILDTLTLDFYIPKYKIGIEHQGSQHFIPQSYFGGERKFKITVENDKRKYELCLNNGIKIVYFSFEKYWVPKNYYDTVYTDIIEFKNKLIELINNFKYE